MTKFEKCPFCGGECEHDVKGLFVTVGCNKCEWAITKAIGRVEGLKFISKIINNRPLEDKLVENIKDMREILDNANGDYNAKVDENDKLQADVKELADVTYSYLKAQSLLLSRESANSTEVNMCLNRLIQLLKKHKAKENG